VVVEVGPGQGLLTRELAVHAGKVLAVELDDALATRLAGEFKGQPHVSVLHADAREVDIERLVKPGTSYKLVANLPYYAASPIIRRFLRTAHKPSLMVVMVQREVAREMAAQPGEMGFLSVMTQLYAKPRVVCTVPPGAFRPRPKVASAVLRLDVLPHLALDVGSEEEVLELVKAGFSAPRKQLHNCLQKGLGLPSSAVRKMLTEAGIEPTRRAETLALSEWGTLYRAFQHTRSER
jgi:16S rRNA (adenine1518-N6/adenine1519-N6)-dimethyltransferase